MSKSQNKHPKIEKVCRVCQKQYLGTTRARFCETCRKARWYKQNSDWAKKHPTETKNFDRVWRSKHPEQRKQITKSWYINKRKSNPEYFRARALKLKDYYQNNRERLLKDKVIYHIKNRDHINIKTKLWRKENPAMVAANNLKLRTRDPIDPELIKLVFKLYEYECMYCCSKENLSLEHILPITRGGDNNFENLGVACKSCNSSKGNKTIVEFMEWREMLTV